MERMASKTLHGKVTAAWVATYLRDPDPTLAELADACLAALGLDDWEAAVDRGGDALADECQDRYDFRMALGQRQILSEIVLRAACTATGEADNG